LGSDETRDFALVAAGPMEAVEALGDGFFIAYRQAWPALDLPCKKLQLYYMDARKPTNYRETRTLSMGQ
jgi:hypothetical protein